MPSKTEVLAYIEKLPSSDAFIAMSDDKQKQYVFSAMETLQHYFKKTDIALNERAVALQSIYQFEGDSEEYAKLKAHGLSSASVKGVSVAFDNHSLIHPSVIEIIEDLNPDLKRRGRVGRLI